MCATGTDKFDYLDFNNLIVSGKAYDCECTQYAVRTDPSVCQIQLALNVAVDRFTSTVYSESPGSLSSS